MQLKRGLFLAWLLLIPFDGTAYLRVEIGLYRLSLLDLLLVLLLYLELLEGALVGYNLQGFARRSFIVAFAATLLSTVSLIYLPTDRLSYDLKISLNLLQFLALLYLTSRTLREPSTLHATLRMLVWAALLVSIATVLKSLGFDIPGDVRRTQPHFGPFTLGVAGLTSVGVPLAMVLVVGLAAVVASARVFSNPLLRMVAIALITVAAALSYTRSVWLGLAVVVALTPLCGAVRRGSSRRRALSGAVALAIVAFAVVGGQQLIQSTIELRPGTLLVRLKSYVHGIDVITASPRSLLFGAGKGYFVETVDEGGVPHNFLLELLVSKGIIVTGLIVAVIARTLTGLVYGLRSPSQSDATVAEILLLSLAGALSCGLSLPIATSLGFWLLISIANAFLSRDPPNTALVGST